MNPHEFRILSSQPDDLRIRANCLLVLPMLPRSRARDVAAYAWTLLSLAIASSCVTHGFERRDSIPIWVVDDGNHNGIVMAATNAPLKPSETVEGNFVEYGFSDRRWMQDRTLTPQRVWELITHRNEGVIVLRVHASLEAAIHERRTHRLLANRDAFARLSDELWSWVRRDGLVEKHEGQTPTFVIESTHSYSLLNNCRVFTARLLQQLADPEEP